MSQSILAVPISTALVVVVDAKINNIITKGRAPLRTSYLVRTTYDRQILTVGGGREVPTLSYNILQRSYDK